MTDQLARRDELIKKRSVGKLDLTIFFLFEKKRYFLNITVSMVTAAKQQLSHLHDSLL